MDSDSGKGSADDGPTVDKLKGRQLKEPPVPGRPLHLSPVPPRPPKGHTAIPPVLEQDDTADEKIFVMPKSVLLNGGGHMGPPHHGAIPNSMMHTAGPGGEEGFPRRRNSHVSGVGSIGEPPTDDEDDDDDEIIEIWDQPLELPVNNEERSCESCLGFLTKLLKVIMYLVFFLLILASIVGTKASLLLILTSIGNLQYNRTNNTAASDPMELRKNRDRWVYVLLIVICMPYAFTFVRNLFRIMFGNFQRPSFMLLLWTLLLESCHSFGLSLMLWNVLTKMDSMRAVLIMTTVGIIPGLLNVFFSQRAGSVCRRAVWCFADVLALLMQVSSLAIFFIIPMYKDPYHQGWRYAWQLPLSVLLISLQWWENFLNKDVHIGGFHLLFSSWKEQLHACRVKLYFVVAPFKICLMVAFAFALVDKVTAIGPLGSLADALSFFDQSKTSRRRNGEIIVTTDWAAKYWSTDLALTMVPTVLLLVLPPVAHYLSTVSAQLKMQQFAFGLSLTLATPVSTVIILSFTKTHPEWLSVTNDGFLQLIHPNLNDIKDYLWALIIGMGVWWVSQMWINHHIWLPKNLRLATNERLFVLPFYCTVLLEQNLMYNRRKNEDSWQESIKMLEKETLGGADDSEKRQSESFIPMIYCCATMWHENSNEMLQMLKSIFRLDEDQATMKNARTLLKETGNDFEEDGDYYEFEAHILFDDAMELNNKNDFTLNSFVKNCIGTVNTAASAMYQRPIELLPPAKIPTPYGGRLVWTMPGENLLVVHLKDKNKIRHRKRWSQIMYMYYLLGYRLMSDLDIDALDALRSDEHSDSIRKQKRKLHFGKSKMFDDLPEKTIAKAENTFIMALDGDVDFKPEAIQLLSDRLKRNKKVGVVCGRIHPIGSGPMVWYQKFEYAISHWLQKASEHVLGCVLCAPGCFSLFRGSALMDDNVMRTYATQATEAIHYLQYDQGEDRWLSTLLLQQGYRVEYVAAADALTYAPETFKEFFNQRRRWGPSTMANIIDLLMSYKRTVKMNDNISLLYIFYQFFIFTSSLLGPATIVLMIAGAFASTFSLSTEWSYFMAVLPPMVYITICFTTKPDTQLAVASVMSAFYSILMVAVLIGTIVQIADKGVFSPSGIFLFGLGLIFVCGALLHPQEIMDLVPGILYYITIPSGYLLLIIYSMVNMNIVSWGTREVTATLLKTGDGDDDAEMRAKQHRGNFIHSLIENQSREDSLCGKLAKFFQQCCSGNRRESETETVLLLNKIRKRLDQLERADPYDMYGPGSTVYTAASYRGRSGMGAIPEGGADDIYYREYYDSQSRDELVNPAWIEEPVLKRSETRFLEQREIDFWKKCIDKYLKPIDTDARFERKVADDLKSLRNNVCFAFFMINALWIAMIFTIQLNGEDLQDIFIRYRVSGYESEVVIEPVGFIFLSIFGITLILQTLSMLWHRWGTLRHIMATTSLDCCSNKRALSDVFSNYTMLKEAGKIAHTLQRLDDGDDDDNPGFFMSQKGPAASTSGSQSPGGASRASLVKQRPSNRNKGFTLREKFEQQLKRINNEWDIPTSDKDHPYNRQLTEKPTAAARTKKSLGGTETEPDEIKRQISRRMRKLGTFKMRTPMPMQKEGEKDTQM